MARQQANARLRLLQLAFSSALGRQVEAAEVRMGMCRRRRSGRAVAFKAAGEGGGRGRRGENGADTAIGWLRCNFAGSRLRL